MSKSQVVPINEHISQGTKHADPKWRKAALAVVKRLARKQETLTTADVLQELEKSEVKTHDLRAIGGVMMECKKTGLIESAGLVRRNDKHTRAATTLWRSKIFSSEAEKQAQSPQHTNEPAA